MRYFHRFNEGEAQAPGLNWSWDGRWFEVRLWIQLGDWNWKVGFDLRPWSRFIPHWSRWSTVEVERALRGEA